MCRKKGAGRSRSEQRAREEAEALRARQAEYAGLLLRGASPAAAAQQVGWELTEVLAAAEADEEFRVRLAMIQEVLSQNVAARLYQEAMKGSVSAMTLWLKHRPPPEWRTEGDEKRWDGLSDGELLELARQEEIAVPVEVAESLAAAGSAAEPEVIPLRSGGGRKRVQA